MTTDRVRPPSFLAPFRTVSGSVLGAILACLTIVAASAATTIPAVRAQDADPAAVPAPPEITAAAALVIDTTTGVPLYALNPDEPRPPGSTVKIATALVVVRNADLVESVVIDPTDLVDTALYSNMGLVAGDSLTVEQLLYGLLLPSGNDAARALARHVGTSLPGGTEDIAAATSAFVAAMNGLADELGLTNTAFANVAGEDADGQFVSARDLATLAGALLDDPTLAEIVATPGIDLVSAGPLAVLYSLPNSNALLADDGIVGVKTGSTEQAGACLVAAKRIGNRNRVISVVLGSGLEYTPDGFQVPESDRRYDDTRALLAALETDYRWVSPTAEGEVPGLAEELAAWGVTLARGPDIPVPVAELDALRYQLVLGPAAEPEAEVGRVLFFVEDRPVGERTVVQV